MNELDHILWKLAAKSAGIEEWRTEATWNPLNDDGDALRLAVQLGIGFAANTMHEPPEAQALILSSGNLHRVTLGHDHSVAVRRAIVIAAATIGREII